MKMNERMKKVFSFFLVLCMVLQYVPTTAFAVDTAEDGLCAHHTEHTTECHYAEAVEGQPCTHVHDELCGYIEAVAEVKCACEATDENGALVHTEGCGYVAPVTGADCAHIHDEACGYVAAVEAHECHYECAECANSDVIANLSADWCGNPLCSQEDAFHVTSCTQYVAPENPQCFCAEKCTEPNVWCDVCGFDYTACTGTDTAVTWDSVDLSCNTSSFGNNRGTWYLNPDNAATEFYNLIDDKLIGGYSYVPERTYITTNAYDYRDNLGNDGYLWTDCKNQTIQDGRYYIYVFTRSASQFNRIEYIVDVQLRYTVNISVTGAPSGYGGVTLNGSNAGSPQYLKKGGSMTLTVKDVPSHKHTVTYDSSVTCSQNGDTYAFSNVNKSFTFKVVYEADEFATVSFGQPEGATISVNGNSTSPVRVTAGMPYTVSVKANDGYYLTGITVDGTTTSLDTTSYNRNLTAGANGAGHTISVTTAKMAIPVNTTASITYTKNQDKASLVNAIKDAVYAGSGSNVNSLTVNYLYFGDFYNPISDYTDIWESVLTAGEMFSCNVKESVSIKLSSGDVYSQACTLYLYDGDISAKGEIKKDYTEEPVKLDGNDFNFAYPANFSSSYPVEYRYYTESGQRLSSAPTEVGKYQVQVKASSDYKANPDAIIGTSWTSWSGLIPFEIVSVPAYSITVENSSGGRVTASKETSIAGKTVTLTIEPDVGYLVDTVSYNGTAITPVEGVYSFTMPAGAVTVSATFKACEHTGGEATCTEQAVCTVCGESYGEPLGHSTTAENDIPATCKNKAYCSVCDSEYGELGDHSYNTTGYCTACGEQAEAKIGDTFYLTFAEAAAKVTEGETIEVLTDVTIAEDETVAFAAFATLDVPEGKNITCSGTVKIGEKDGIIFENQLYYLGALCADSSIGIDLVIADPYTYYPAGDDGYAIYEGNGILRLHNAVITTPDAVSTNHAECIRSNDTGNLTIYFSGKNTLTSGNTEDSNASIYVEGDLTLIAEGENAELTVRSGNSSGNTPGISANSLEVQGGTVTATGGNSSGSTSYGIYVDTDLTISSGIVNAHGGSGMMSLGVGASTITVADGAALYTTGGEATFASAGIQAATISGNVNALRVSINETELAIDYTVYGDLVPTKDLTIFDPFAGVEVAEEYAFTVSFTVPEGTSLTVNEGVTLDLTDLTMDDIDFTGTVINNGTILLPEGFNIANAPKSGNVKIGEKSYTWDSADNKWICGEGSHIFDEITRICSVCGEVETFTVTWRDGYDADSETWAYEQTTEIAYGETITPPDYEAEKTGYTFGGWRFWLDEYNEEEFTGTVMPAQDLYAQPQYTPIEYKITWILNGCKVDPRFESELPETLPYNGDEDPGTISIHLVAPEGCRIAGYKDGNGNALRYSEGNGYLTVPVTGETTVEVVVEPLPFTLTVWAIDFAEGNEAPSSGRVELTVPYGEKLIDYIEQYKAGSSDEDKPIYMLNETVTVNGKEYEGTFTVSQWLEDISYTEIDIQTATMPAKDYSIMQDYSFTGWVYDYYNEEGHIVAECLGTCYWAGNEYLEGWQLIDGSLYCFVYNEKQMEYYRAEGLAQVPMQNSEETALHLFTEDGKWRSTFTGLYTDTDGKKYHVENGIVVEKHEYTYKNNGTTHTGTCACGDSFTEEHTLTYTVEGNMLTAACSVCKEANVGSVSVTVQDKTYDGAPMEAKVTVVGLAESAEYTVTYTGTTRGGTVYNSTAAPQDAGDYTATLEIGGVKAETQFTIEPKEITFTFKFFGPAAKTYDGTVDVGIMKVNPSGLIEGDSIYCTCDMTARFEDPNVGESKTLTISGCKLGGEDAANYWVESTYTATMSIVPRTVTITGATIEDVLYDENGGYDLKVSSISFSGIVNGETLTQGVDYTLSAALTGKNKPGTAAVQVTVTLLNGNYSLSNTTVDTTVNLLVHAHEWKFSADPMNPNRIIVNCLGEIGECSIPDTSFSVELQAPNTVYNGMPKDAFVVFGEPDTGITADVTYSTEDRVNVTGQPITATLKLGSAEAAVTYTVVKAVIGEAPFSVTAPEANGEPQSAVSGGEYHTAEIRWNTDAEVFGFNTAYTAVVTLTADGNHKFASDLAQEGWTANVSADGSTAAFTKTFPATRKAKLTALTDAPAEQKLAAYHIDADGAIGELPATVTYTSESGDVTVDIQWSCADYNAATKAQNTFAWSVKSGELDNYDANGKAISGTVTVTNLDPIPVTNIGTDKTVTYDGSDIDLRTLFTLDQNAGEADYTIIDLSGEGTITGAPYLYRVEKAGTFTVKVSTAAKDPYAKGEAVATLTVNKAAGEGSVTIEGWTYGEEANAPVADGTGAVTFHYSTEDGKAPTDVGTYTVTATFTATDLYEQATATADFTVNKAKLTVTAEDNTVTYGDAPAANGAVISGFVGAESAADLSGKLTFTYTYEQFGNVGTYKITPSGLTSGNYEITFVDGTLTVNAKPITVTADEVTKTYGEADPTLTYKVEGLVNGDQLTGELKRAEGEDVGTYAIGQNTLTAGNNYTISYTGAELTVTKRSVTVTAKDQTVIYGETISGTEFTAAGLLEGHSAAVTLTPSTAKVTVNGIITPSAAAITADGRDVTSNYEISYADGKLEIHPDTSRLDDLTTENVTSDDAADIQAVQDMLDNAESTREEWEEISDLCNDLTEKIEETAKENERIAEEASKFDLDNVQSSDEETVSDLISDIEEQLATDNLTDEERNELEGLKTKCEDLIAKIDGTEELMDQLEKEVEDRDEDTVKSTDKAALEQVIEDADALIGSGNVTEAEKEALEKVKEEAEKLIDVIEDTASAKQEATDAAESFDEETVKSTDQEALEKAKEAIEDLLDTDNLTEDERSALEEVLDQVDGMIETLEGTASGSKDAADAVENLKPETVTSESKDELTEAIETIEELLKTDHLTEEERKALEETKAEAEKLIDAIEAAQDAADTDNTQKVENVTSENVKPEDKEALEDAREDLEKALEDNAGNYTEEEKQAIQDEIQRIESAVETLEKVEDVTETVAKLPDTVEPDDEATAKEILAAKEAYDALTDHEKSLVDEDTTQKLEGLVAALTAYEIIKGDGSKWMQNKDGDLSFTANGAFSKFVGIEVDGKHVDEKHYDAKSGSTVITLKQSFLKKLSAGEHTLTVIYTDGKTSGTFFVQEEAMSPATGDSSNIVFWTSTMFVSMAALMVLLAESKKRRTVK